MKRLFAVMVALAVASITTLSVSAANYGCDIDPVSSAVYVENLDTDTVVFTKNAETRMYPASTTKVMTYIIVAENVPDFDSTMITIEEAALATLDPESSVMGLEYHIGESFSVRDLLYGLMLPSGNDAALVLADYVGHGIDGFVDMMNRKAAQLGCDNTHFVNPHGLFDPNHYSTARDMAVITKYALDKQSFREISDTTRYTPAGFDEPLETTNYLIDSSAQGGAYYYPYAKGIKTGYTDEAGKCLISTAEKGEYTYLCIALGAAYSYSEDINYAMLDTVKLYDWAFDNLSTQTVYGTTDVLKSIPVGYVWGDRMLSLVPENDVVALLPNGYDESLVSTTVDCKDAAYAPVKKGDTFGTISVYYDDLFLGSTSVIASEDVDRDFTNYLAHKVVNLIRTHFILFAIGFVIVVLIIISAVSRARIRKQEEARRRFK